MEWIQLVNVPKHAKGSLQCSFLEQMISEMPVATQTAVIVSVKPAQMTTELVILFSTTAIVCTSSFSLVNVHFELNYAIKTFFYSNSLKLYENSFLIT